MSLVLSPYIAIYFLLTSHNPTHKVCISVHPLYTRSTCKKGIATQVSKRPVKGDHARRQSEHRACDVLMIDVAQIARDIRQVQALPGDAPTMLISVTRQSNKHV